MTTTDTRLLRIGAFAADLGLNPKTIRYYEGIGLLPIPKRSRAGYRLYDAADRERLRFIGKAKGLGLTLQEIRDILTLWDHGERPCQRVVALLDRKLAAVNEALRALGDFRQELAARREAAADRVTTDAHICRIIEQGQRTHPGEHLWEAIALATNRSARRRRVE